MKKEKIKENKKRKNKIGSEQLLILLNIITLKIHLSLE